MEVYERVGISVISDCKKAQKGQQMHFVAVKKSKKRSGVVVNSYFKDSASTKSVTRYVKEVKHALVNRRYTLCKMVNRMVRVGPRGWASPYKALLSTPWDNYLVCARIYRLKLTLIL